MTMMDGTPFPGPAGELRSAGTPPARPGVELPAVPVSPPPGTLPAPRRNDGEENGGDVAAVPRTNPQVENIEALGTNALPNPAPNIHLLSVIGQIEGHLALPPQNKTTKYEHVIPQLVAVEQDPRIEGLLVVLNTVGGDVEAGLAMAEMIASLSKPSVSLVLGGGHSIGLPIAVSTTYSFIASTATMTIHPIRLTGLVIGVPIHKKMHRVRMRCTTARRLRSGRRRRGCRASSGSGWLSGWERVQHRAQPGEHRAHPGGQHQAQPGWRPLGFSTAPQPAGPGCRS